MALNNFVPANMGTFVMLLMYVAIVRGATFPGVLGGYVVQKIFYFIIGTLIYIYLFSASRARSTSSSATSGTRSRVTLCSPRDHRRRDLPRRHPAPHLLGWVKKMWAKAKQGAAILGDLRAYVKWVLLPQIGGYAAKVMVIIVFLAAYGIPVTFGSVMSVLGSNQLANILSFTPGGIGVNQAFNTFALESYTDTTTATAYSLGQQLITTAFNVGFAILLVCVVFGWQGGSTLVQDSYADAKVKKDEMSEDAARSGRRSERRAAQADARAAPAACSGARTRTVTTRGLTRATECERVETPCVASPSSRDSSARASPCFVWWIFGDKVDAAFNILDLAAPRPDLPALDDARVRARVGPAGRRQRCRLAARRARRRRATSRRTARAPRSTRYRTAY